MGMGDEDVIQCFVSQYLLDILDKPVSAISHAAINYCRSLLS